MPHIHTQPNQHDMTVSAWIIRKLDNDLMCLVHFHKKIEKFMQIGGHIELDETPWQAMANEIEEESGYTLSQLKIAQHSDKKIDVGLHLQHPTPFSMNTHNVNDGHYHSDLCYGFFTDSLPKNNPVDGESSDLKWVSLSELKQLSESGEALLDVYLIYKFLLDNFNSYFFVPADYFSLEKPKVPSSTYKYGKPGEKFSK